MPPGTANCINAPDALGPTPVWVGLDPIPFK